MRPLRLDPPVDHLNGVGYAVLWGLPTDHRLCRSHSGVPLHGLGFKPNSAGSKVFAGHQLTPINVRSPSGLYAFGFYQQGSSYSVGIFISGIPEKTVVWMTNRDDPLVNQTATLVLTADGRLVLQRTQRQETNIAPNSQSAYSISMLDMGNFVLYNSDGGIIW
ncbi:hypothetical protein LguiA_013463 [Lonicera macranthoides]